MSNRPPVLLVHGLWLTGHEFFRMRRKLKEDGWETERFRYCSVCGDCNDHVQKLARDYQRLKDQNGVAPILVCHSLGGVLALRMLQLDSQIKPSALVLLGSPVNGSLVARQLRSRWGMGWMVGVCGALLEVGVPLRSDMAERTFCVIGNKQFGLGMVFAKPSPPHDGVVGVDEAHIDGVETSVVCASHTSMLYKTAGVRLVLQYLRKKLLQ